MAGQLNLRAAPTAARAPTNMHRLTGRALKVTVVLDPAQLAEISVPDGAGPQRFQIEVAGRKVTGQLNAKSLRRAVAMVVEHGTGSVAVIVQGKLEAGDVLADAGIAAQLKAPKTA